MTSDRLLHALGEIDPEFIEEAIPQMHTVSKRRPWIKYGSLAAGLLLFCLIGVSVIGMPGTDGVSQADFAANQELANDLYDTSGYSAGGNVASSTQIIRPTPQQGSITNVVIGNNDSNPRVININSVEGKFKPANAVVDYTFATITVAEQDTFAQVTGIDYDSFVAGLEDSSRLYNLIEIYEQANTKTEEPPVIASDVDPAATDDLSNVERAELPVAYEVILNSYGVPAYLYIDTNNFESKDWQFTQESDLYSDIKGVDVRFYSFSDGWIAMFEHHNLGFYLEVHGLDIAEIVSMVENLLQ